MTYNRPRIDRRNTSHKATLMTETSAATRAPATIGWMLRTIRRALPKLALYETFYRILTAAVIGPLLAAGLTLLLRLTGDTAVTNQDIAAFLLHPIGLVGLLITAAVVTAVLFVEWAGLFDLLDIIGAGGRRTATITLVRSMRKLPDFAVLGVLQLGIGAVAAVPFAVAIFLVQRKFLGAHDINYYLAGHLDQLAPALLIVVPVLAVFAFIAVRLYIQWIFALPMVMLDGLSPRQALRKSKALTRGYKFRIAVALGIWWVICLVVLGLAGALFRWIGGLILDLTPARLGPQLVLLSIVFAGHLVIAFAFSSIGVTGHVALAWRFFRLARPRQASPAAINPDGYRFRSAVWIGLAAFALLIGVGAFRLVRAPVDPHPVAIMAHRGASHYAPENTRASIREAVNQRADGAEIDVQTTSDGVVVLLHDGDLMRVANDPRKLADLTYAELKQVDVGTHFDPTFAGERAPTLAQAMDATGGKITLNIEVKYNGPNPGLPAAVVEVIRKKRFADRCIISSLNAAGAAEVKALMPELEVGVITAAYLGDLAGAGWDFISAERGVATRSFVKSVHRHGKEIYVWTVNDPNQMVHFITLGVDGILTDDPATLRELVDDYQELSDPERLLLMFRHWLAD